MIRPSTLIRITIGGWRMAKMESAAVIAVSAVIVYVIYTASGALKGLGNIFGGGGGLPSINISNPFSQNQTYEQREFQSREYARDTFEEAARTNNPNLLKYTPKTFTPYVSTITGNEVLGQSGTAFFKNVNPVTGRTVYSPASIPVQNPFREGLRASPVDPFRPDRRGYETYLKIMDTDRRAGVSGMTVLPAKASQGIHISGGGSSGRTGTDSVSRTGTNYGSGSYNWRVRPRVGISA